MSRLKLNRDSGFASKIGTEFCLNRDGWKLCKGFREVRWHAYPEKIRNLSSSNCWKCIEIVNLTITTLFCIILNLLRSHQADLFGSGGGGVGEGGILVELLVQ